MKCKACERDSGEKEFCQFHSDAYKNIVRAYEDWRKGLRISWEDYLRRIRNNSLTGEWVKEVTEYLLNTEEKRNV